MGVAVVRPLTFFFVSLFSLSTVAQTAPRILVTNPIDENHLTVLKGNTHPLARPEFDQGAAPADLPMNRMLLVLKRSDEQEAALRSLIDNQQDKASPSYHSWLPPDAFGKEFGPSDQDIAQVTLWLQSHGFQIAQVSKGRTVIEFSGTAAQVQEALHTSIHKYAANGEQHWGNASDPQIPAALTPVVAGVESLNNFPRKPMLHVGGVISREKPTGEMKPLQPLFTFPGAGGGCGVQPTNCYGVGPYDFATIYNVLGAWNATPAVDGTGQTIAIVGETDINPQDIADFRNFFGLPALTASQLNIIHNGPAPGILTDGEETESDLDLEWSSAVAKGATIDFVVSQATETTAGIDLSAQYIIDNNLAPVMSESYGLCELGLGSAGNSFYNQLWQQAAAQGITVFISSGDTGSAGCSSQDSAPPAPSLDGLAVSGFASTPYNVAVGGTDFNDLTNASTYWNPTNASTTQASALSYIPETTWNNTCTNSVFGTLGFSTSAETNCNNARLSGFVSTVGGSGGQSNCTSSDGRNPASCSGGYAKPSWQSGSGVPPDGVRDIPDVSLFAAAGSPSGSFYIVCEADVVSGNSCNPANSSTQFLGVGGTSASAPAFAGIMALVNQHTNSRQGNANYVFYKLAANQPGVFNDVPAGSTIAMPCQSGSPNCTTLVSGDQYGVLSGYSSGAGYDLATGLGSVNVANLVNKWNTVSFNASTTTLTSLAPTTITHGQAVNVTVKVTGSSGTATGLVSLFGGASGTQFIDSHPLDTTGTATWTSKLFPGGSYGVKAHYAGDGNYGSSNSAASAVVVNKESSSAHIQVVAFDGNQVSNNTSGANYGSAYLVRVDVMNSAGLACSTFPQLQSGCPSGSVAISDSNSPLDAGTYTLNSLGYLEDQTVQFPVGVHGMRAVYAGESSYIASTSLPFQVTIMAAPTSVVAPAINSPVTVGASLQSSVTVQAQGSGVAPGGTVTFFANGTIISGSVSYTPVAASATVGPHLIANFSSSASPFPKSGAYAISATYSGDANYLGSTSAATSITVKFPQPQITLQPSAPAVTAGTTVTLTATAVSSSPATAPTGTFTFSSNAYGPLPGTPTYTTVTDQSGNLDLQATLAYTINASDSFGASYSGDSNYPGGNAPSIQIGASGSDFNLAIPQGTITVAKGQSNAVNLIVGAQSGAAAIVFSTTPCMGLPAEATCTVSPSTVTGTSIVQLTVATTGAHSAAQKRVANTHRPSWWITGFGATSVGIFLFGVPGIKRRRGSLITLSVLGVLTVGLGCGGGSSSGGTVGGAGTQTDPGTPVGTYAVTLTGTSGTLSHTAKFSLVVQ